MSDHYGPLTTDFEGAVKPDAISVDSYERDLFAKRVTLIETNQQAKWDYDASGNVIYAGFAPMGLPESMDGWLIQKYTYSGGKRTARQVLIGSWDNRTTLNWHSSDILTTINNLIGNGSQDVVTGYVLNEDGTYALNEDGSRISLETTPPEYVLNEDGSYALNEDGTRILVEGSSSGLGVATSLLAESTSCSYVLIRAKSTNAGIIWVGGSTVEENVGIPLLTTDSWLTVKTKDVSSIYIIGTVGDGVTFLYDYLDITYEDNPNPDGLLQFGGDNLQFGGDDLTFKG